MFCGNCGREMQEGWVKCPYCGEEVEGAGIAEAPRIVEASRIAEEPPGVVAETQKVAYRSFWKYVFLSLITCGIYGIVVLCGYVRDINKVCGDDGKESKGYIVVLLLTLVTCGIYGFYWWYTQGQRLHQAAPRYGVNVREKGSTILLWMILLPGFGPMVATYIMFDNLNIIAKVYNGEASENDAERMARPHPHLIRNVLIALAVYFVFVAVVIGLLISMLFSIGSSETMDIPSTTDETFPYSEFAEDLPADLSSEVTETQDFSDVDLEVLLGLPGETLIEMGFTYADETAEFQILDGAVFANCENGVVRLVGIRQPADGLPGFHDVKIGMSLEAADKLLSDEYRHGKQENNEVFYANVDAGIAILLTVEDGKVSTIAGMKLTDEEIQELYATSSQSEAGQEEAAAESTDSEFIFPDSDKRELTWEEVSGLNADQLRIARNEIFARHGYIFNSEDLSEYFGSLSWYEGTVPAEQFNSDEIFNEYEKENVALIKEIENESDVEMWEGDYYKTDFDSDREAVAWIYYDGSDGVEMTVGTVPESSSMTLYGERKSDGTMVLTDEYLSVTVILTPDGERAFTLKSTELPEGMDAELFEDLLNGRYEHGEVS